MSSLACPCRNCDVVTSRDHQSYFINHIRQHIQCNQLTVPFICGQNSCSKTFVDLNAFSNHLNSFHHKINRFSEFVTSPNERNKSRANNELSMNIIDLNDNELENVSFNGLDNFQENDSPSKVNQNELKSKAYDLINHFRSKHQFSQELLDEVIDLFGEFIFDLIEIAQSEVFKQLNLDKEKKANLQKFFQKINRPLAFLSSTYEVNQIALLVKFVNYADDLEIFSTKKHFAEHIEPCDFRFQITAILNEQNSNFKVYRLTYLDNDFNEYVDITEDFIFENLQKFKIYCQVSKK